MNMRRTQQTTIQAPTRSGGLVRAYFVRHAQTLISSLGRIFNEPASSLLTIAVIAIALALPMGMHTLLENSQRLQGHWDGAARISLFLKHTVEDKQGRELARSLKQRSEIRETTYISRDEALAEFQRLSGFEDALRALDQNPLPGLIVVTPTPEFSDASGSGRLVTELGGLEQVDLAQLDLQWLRRLNALLETAQRAVFVVAGLLALAVLLIVGNTIRLDIENRRDEIVVTKLIGGTDAFIRRPFLYTGFWYGLLGGLLAWLLIVVSLLLLDAPVQRLALLYQSAFSLTSPDFSATLALFGFAALLGLAGSWIAVGRHLSAIEPT